MEAYKIIETREANRSLEHHCTLLEINNALITNLGLDELLGAVSRVLRRAIPFDGASLTIPDLNSGRARFYVLGGEVLSAPLSGEQMSLRHLVTGSPRHRVTQAGCTKSKLKR